MERPNRSLNRHIVAESIFRRRFRRIAHRLVHSVLRILLVPLYKLKIDGRTVLADTGAAVTVMNHCLYMEWFFLCRAAWPRLPRFSMEEANIRRRDIGWANRLMGGFGIPDDRPMDVLPIVRRLLKDGELVHFFPEGVLRHRSRIPGDFLPGAAWFACMHDVPLIPIAEILMERPIHRLLPWWPPSVRISVGPPLHPRDFIRPGESLRRRAKRMTGIAEGMIHQTIREATVRHRHGRKDSGGQSTI